MVMIIVANMVKRWSCYEKALVIREKVLGLEHPDTAQSYNNIANRYYNQGDYDKALEWYEKAYRICLRKLGEAHPDSIRTKNNMKTAYQASGLSGPFEQWLQGVVGE